MPTVREQMQEEARRRKEAAAAEQRVEQAPGPTQAKVDLARSRRVEDYRRELLKRQSGGNAPLFEHGVTLGLDVPLSGLAAVTDFWSGGDTSMGERYEAGEAARRAKLNTAEAEAVVPPIVQEMAGSLVGLPPAGAAGAWLGGARAIPVAEQTALRTGLEAGGVGAGTGFVHGVAAGEGGVGDRIKQGLKEAAIGGVGSSLLAGGAARAGGDLDYLMAEPRDRAAQAIYSIAQRNGLTPQAIHDAIQRYGPETMALDVLGEVGRGTARSAANVSPEARELLTTATAGRAAGENQRLVDDVQRASGIQPGSRETVQNIIDRSYEARRPAIDSAYDAARRAGQELPDEPFRAILESPMGRQAYEAAGPSLLNRSAVRGNEGVTGALARLDQTKIRLDNMGRMFRRTGDNDSAAQAEMLAAALRQRIDDVLQDPIYAEARALRQAAFREQEAIQAGEQLAGRPGLGGAADAGQFTGNADQLTGMRAGYAQETADRLLSRQPGANSLNEMSTPLATETRNVVFGAEAPTIENAMARERLFRQGNEAVRGNSTTVRQMIESGLGGGSVGAGVGMGLSHLFGSGALTVPALATAALGAGSTLLHNAVPAIQRRMAAPVATAAEVGRILSGGPQGIPMQRAIDPGFLSRLAASIGPALGRVGTGVINQIQAPPPVAVEPEKQSMNFDMPVPVDDTASLIDPRARNILRQRGLG